MSENQILTTEENTCRNFFMKEDYILNPKSRDEMEIIPVSLGFATAYNIEVDRYYMLTKNIKINFDGYKFFIAKGFCLDFASVPEILKPLIYDIRETDIASLIHDALYCKTTELGKVKADKIFYNKLIDDNYHPDWANIFYWSVYLFGFIAYYGQSDLDEYNKQFVCVSENK